MPTVLIVERSQEIRELLALLVGRCGHEPIFAEDAVDGSNVALALLEPSDPGALELAATLRARDPGLPFVFVSIEPATECTRAFAPSAHVEKPFTLAQLTNALLAALPS